MAWTTAQVRNAVLTHLGIMPRGGSASAEDAAIVDDFYTSEYPRLRKMGLAPWAIGAVTDASQDPLVRYLAGKVAPKFGYTGQRLADLQGDMHEARREMEAYEASDQQYDSEIDYF